MKRLILAVASLAIFWIPARAADSVVEAPIGFVGGPFTINPTTYTWTRIYYSTAVVSETQGRSHAQAGLVVNNKLSNTKSFGCVLSTGTPTVSTMTWSVQIDPGENPLIPIVDSVYLYCVSLHTAPEKLDGQFVRQNP